MPNIHSILQQYASQNENGTYNDDVKALLIDLCRFARVEDLPFDTLLAEAKSVVNLENSVDGW